MLYNKREHATWQLNIKKSNCYFYRGIFGENSEDVAGAIGNFGVVYSDMNDFENADKYLKKTLEIYNELFGEESYDVSRIYQSLGAQIQEAGDYNKAEITISNEIKIKTLDSTHYSLAQMYSNIGVNNTYQKKYDIACAYFNKAIPISFLNYGERSANNALLFNNIGDMYKWKGDYL